VIRQPRPLVWGLLAVALTAGGGAATWSVLAGVTMPPFGRWARGDQDQGVLETLGMYGEVPDFALAERSGRTITRADLLSLVWLANFIYTQCAETCPLQSAVVARLQAEFAGARDLRFVSITVDPERDTVAVLARYAERYGADPLRWWFLTGDKRAIYRLAKEGFRLGVVDADDPAPSARLHRWLAPAPAFATHGSRGLVMHSSRLVLVDRQARIRAYHLPNDERSLGRLRRNLNALVREAPKGT
jgi:protein SCO1/2